MSENELFNNKIIRLLRWVQWDYLGYCKNPKLSDTGKTAVIILKVGQCGYTNHVSHNMQTEWQTLWPLIRSILVWVCLVWVYTVCPDLSVPNLRILQYLIKITAQRNLTSLSLGWVFLSIRHERFRESLSNTSFPLQLHF